MSLETLLGVVDAALPGAQVSALEGHYGGGDALMASQYDVEVREARYVLVLLEVLDRLVDLLEQLASPRNGAANGRRVARQRRIALELVEVGLGLLEVLVVVGEYLHVLVVEHRAQYVALHDRLELGEYAEAVVGLARLGEQHVQIGAQELLQVGARVHERLIRLLKT